MDNKTEVVTLMLEDSALQGVANLIYQFKQETGVLLSQDQAVTMVLTKYINKIENTQRDKLLSNEMFMVIRNNANGTLPDPIKRMHVNNEPCLFDTFEEAVLAKDNVNDVMGVDTAGVYLCHVTVLHSL